MDIRSDLVQQVSERVTHAVVGDGQDKEVLKALGAGSFDCAIIAIGDDLAAELENNGVMGVIDSVDVSDSETIILWYDSRYQVSLGDSSRLDYKVGAMKSSVKKMGQYQSGYLDVSFTIWPNEVGYRPFDSK